MVARSVDHARDSVDGRLTVAVVGNPNCGKTSLFNALTGGRQEVGNWAGVTVEKKVGHLSCDGLDIDLVDLPGTYSLGAGEASIDETIARQVVSARGIGLVVNIVDAAHLERNLYLTTQLLDMRLPIVVAVNMLDVARRRGLRIDLDILARRLDCPVVAINAARGQGMDKLRAAIADLARSPVAPSALVAYPDPIERRLADLASALEPAARDLGADSRWLALRRLDGGPMPVAGADDTADRVERALAEVEAELGEDVDILLADARYGFIEELAGQVIERPGRLSRSRSEQVDRLVLHRLLGIPIFLGVMYLMFLWTINVGSAFIDFFDLLSGSLLVDGVGSVMSALGSPDWLRVVIADGIGGGITTVATFVPIIACLYLFLSVLEDSGYMARAAFVMDRLMQSAGLPGKAFVPLIVGFGCNVPAIMAARTLDSDADRKITVMMSPFISCGARLPVYALFAAAFFPTNGQNLVFALYLIGILVAVLTGFVLKHTLLSGANAPLVMELPPYHRPVLRNILRRTWDRLRAFIVGAGQIIVPLVMVLTILNSVAPDGSFGHEDSDRSVLASVGRAVTPAFEPMGIEPDNWPATVGIFTGIFAKEAVVGTLDALYGNLGAGADAAAEEPAVVDGVREAFASVPANLRGLAASLADPLGLDVGTVDDPQAAAEEQEVAEGTFGALVERFEGPLAAFAYLLFILLYFPCAAALAAIRREVDLGWALFAAAWTTVIAYMTATVVYQAGSLAADPARAVAWLLIMAVLLALAVGLMRVLGRTRRLPARQAAE